MSTLDRLRYIEDRLEGIEAKGHTVITKLGEVMAALSDLTDQVNKSTAVEASALALIQGISQRLADAAGDPAALEALTQELEASSDALAAAVAANTPAAGAGSGPAPDPVPAPGESPTTTAGSADIAPVDPAAPTDPADPNTDPANAQEPAPPTDGAATPAVDPVVEPTAPVDPADQGVPTP